MSIVHGVHSAQIACLASRAVKALLALTVAMLAACGGGGDGASVVNAEALAAGPVVSEASAGADLAFIPHAVDLVNTTLPGEQTARAIGAVADGGYTVAWLSKGEPGNTTGTYRLFIQRYDAAGAKLGGETLVPFDLAIEPNPAISVLGDGGVMVAYGVKETDPLQPWILHSGIYTRRFDSGGVPVGGVTEIAAMDYNQIGAEFTYYLEAPSLVTWLDGRHMVAWMLVEAGPFHQVRTSIRQRYDSEGAATGPRRSSGLDGLGFDIAFAAIEDGGYLQTYTAYLPPLHYVRFFPYDSPGRVTPIPPTGFYPAGSSILPLGDGGYVLWSSDNIGPYSRILGSAGDVLGAPTLPRGDAYALNDGGFVVFWIDTAATPGQPALVAQRFDGAGSPLGDEIRLDTNGATPVITTLPDGGLALAWTAASAESGTDVYTQRLGPPQSTRQAKVKTCKAAAQGLKGAEHKQFMRDCLNSA